MSSETALILIDTAARTGLVAIARGQTLLAQSPLNPQRGHARDLTRTIRSAMANVSLKLTDITAIGINVGPGSFTGIRVALATAKALAYATSIRLASTTTFDLVAQRFRDLAPKFRVIVDFQMNAWLVADYIDSRIGKVRRLEPSAVGELMDAEMPLVGPGAAKLLRAHPNAPRLNDTAWEPRAEDLLAQVSRRVHAEQFDNPLTIEPYYATVSSAEQMWDARRTGISE